MSFYAYQVVGLDPPFGDDGAIQRLEILRLFGECVDYYTAQPRGKGGRGGGYGRSIHRSQGSTQV